MLRSHPARHQPLVENGLLLRTRSFPLFFPKNEFDRVRPARSFSCALQFEHFAVFGELPAFLTSVGHAVSLEVGVSDRGQFKNLRSLVHFALSVALPGRRPSSSAVVSLPSSE